MRIGLWIAGLGLMAGGCKFLGETRFVSIDPDYAYTDGCTQLTLSGSELGVSAVASIGGNEIEQFAAAVDNPDLPEHAQDVGFMYSGVSPAASSPDGGFVDVDFTLDGETYTLDRGFYYIACPDTFAVDATGEGETNAPGAVIPVSGCGLDDDTTEAVFYSQVDASELAAVPMVADCRGAEVSFTVPDLPDGDYYFQIRDSNGTTYGDVCEETDPDTDTDPDTAVDPCADLELIPFTIAAGGAR
jgi:hypothetical protein